MTKITHQVEIRGILAPLFALVLGRKIKAGVLDAMTNLVSASRVSAHKPE